MKVLFNRKELNVDTYSFCTWMFYIDGGVLIPGDITGDRAGDNELDCSILDGVLAFDKATASTSLACSSCRFSGCWKNQ